jgi:hypothetical protein
MPVCTPHASAHATRQSIAHTQTLFSVSIFVEHTHAQTGATRKPLKLPELMATTSYVQAHVITLKLHYEWTHGTATHTHTHIDTYTHTRTHAHTHTQTLLPKSIMVFGLYLA